jgi:DTW domain-containing protein YfiP
MCYRCFKSADTCICALIKQVDNRTGVFVVQHVRERNHPIGTERFLRLGLGKFDIAVCTPSDPPSMQRAIERLPSGAALLYPSADAAELDPASPPEHLVIVDATWGHAKTLIRDAPWLTSLPRVRLNPTAPSDYRIRREPRVECLSSLEATIAALKILEPDTVGFDELLLAFRTMIDQQITYWPRGRSQSSDGK